MRPTLVTGATGFVGGALVPVLLAEGREVHALARPTSNRAPLSAHDVRWHAGDLNDAPSLRRALRAVGAAAERAGEPPDVVHGAALISYRTRDAELARRVNVDGTGALLAAAREVELGRFLFVSSVVAVGHAVDPGGAVTEDSPFNGGDLGSHYVSTKRAAEELVLGAASDLDVVAVNPGAIFGPAPSGSNTTRFLERIERGGAILRCLPPGSLSVVGVSDVAEGIRLALKRAARGRRFLLTRENLSLVELVAAVQRALGREAPRPRSLSPGPWRAVCRAATALDRLWPLRELGPQALRLGGLHFRADSTRAREELGWTPRPLAGVLDESVAWLRGRNDSRAGA